MQLTIVNQR